MNGLPPPEGKLDIAIYLAAGNDDAHGVDIHSTRPVHIAQMFVGKSVTETLTLTRALFHVCTRAQLSASVQAVESARGVAVAPGIAARRQALVDMETLREHLWRLYLDWPGYTGAERDHDALAQAMQLQQRFDKALANGQDLFLPGASGGAADHAAAQAVLDDMATLIERTALGESRAAWQSLESYEALQAWSGNNTGSIAGLLRHLARRDWNASAALETIALPALDALQARELAAQMHYLDFVTRPTWQGRHCETSSLSRSRSPLVGDIQRRFGAGLLARAVALVSEAVSLLDTLRRRLANEVTPATLRGSGSEPGVGWVEAARGCLVHTVELAGDTITDYRILAPTEWNFHPGGVLSQALSRLRGDAGAIREQAAMLIELMDPCIGYTLSLHGPGRQHA
ncbi:hypothetical protein E4634_09445 [Mangrovimicrobium sediminis]|uniref:Ni,Fe-hydrogenase I large subunit n=1 Tax=Mangrovimicrobium sediminis TaxID=2562682 RepID=A0A4Z0M4G6_9GAMM|nr:nickel-dependent hydrogenase large subunit [Haliea sp. SAOS-164]TGD74330.1 hypothetical protein E4634_09445 [Haliea sp. SAOS-164]